MLIAMMSNSYQIISVSRFTYDSVNWKKNILIVKSIFAQERADTEWKFARTQLWMSYFEDGGTLPPRKNFSHQMQLERFY